VKQEPEELVVAASTTVRSYASALSLWIVAAACAGTSERSASLAQVDALLTRIERVQAETAVAKDAAHAAMSDLITLVSPGFQGDAAKAFAKYVASMEASEEQGETLRDATEPMADTAEDLFHRWTKDMESFGNSRMRQRSQVRLDETRTRYQGIVGATQAAQIALDTFNDDLRDNALFLQNDLNAASVASLRSDVRELKGQLDSLDLRFDATVAAARAYVESAALYGQVEMENMAVESDGTSTSGQESTDSNSNAAATPTRKRTVTTLKPKAATTKGTSTTPAPKPAEGSEPAPQNIPRASGPY
jgi:hypothetical protein